MPYDLIDTSANNYGTLSGDPFTDFDAGQVFLDLLRSHFPALDLNTNVISICTGTGNRRQTLFEISFNSTPSSSFYVYCFQTEGGGRWNSKKLRDPKDEARIQWRKHSKWTPDLSTIPKAKEFKLEADSLPNDLSNKECYLFSFYKRTATDNDIVISAAYPTQAQDVEITSSSNKSIQFSYARIKEAYNVGYSQQKKDNNEFFFHFKPKYLISYMLNRDQIHKQALEGVLRPSGAIITPTDHPYNLIYFGAPGTGKSRSIKGYTTEDNSITITFHPDTDYATFVGSYKPVQKTDENGISYDFVAQAFIQAYLKAWECDEDVFLVIEEINRGNCAQIFGDVFQMIERGQTGYSKYQVDIDTELGKYLKKYFEALQQSDDSVKAERYLEYFDGSFKKMALPNNLFIHATMNTSDQSLFPIDSAFKRRWDWEYVPIEFKDTEANDYKLNIGNEKYSWRGFVEAVNEKIETITESEDKKLGPFFVKSYDKSISEKKFKAKVLFYIWNDILKDEPKTDETFFFRNKVNDADLLGTPFSFSDLFPDNDSELLRGFMKYLGLEALDPVE